MIFSNASGPGPPSGVGGELPLLEEGSGSVSTGVGETLEETDGELEGVTGGTLWRAWRAGPGVLSWKRFLRSTPRGRALVWVREDEAGIVAGETSLGEKLDECASSRS